MRSSDPRDHLLPGLALAGIYGFGAVTTLLWLGANSLPDGLQNEFIHLQRAVELFFRARDLGGSGVGELLWRDYYPPLLAAVGAGTMALGARSEDALAASNLLWLALLLASLYGLGTRMGGRWVGVLAAALVCLYPSIFGNLRHHEPNLALTALGAAAVWALAASRNLTRTGPTVAFAAALAAGLLADRISMAPLLAVPGLAALSAGLRRPGPGGRGRVALRAGVVAALVCLVCGYFYWNFVTLHAGEIAGQVSGEIDAQGTRTEHRSPLSPLYWLYYPLTWIDMQMGLALALAALVALVASFRGLREPGAETHRLVLLWLVGGLAIFSLLGKKQPYYTLPLLPAAALLTARWLIRLRPQGLAAGLTGILVLAGLLQWSAMSFARPEPPDRGPVGWLMGNSPVPEAWIGYRFPQARPPKQHDLHWDEALAAIRADGFDPAEDRLAVFGDLGEFYEGYMVPMARLGLDTFQVDGVLLFPRVVREKEAETDYFLFVTSDPSATWPEEHHVARTHEEFVPPWEGDAELMAALERMRDRATLVGEWEQGTGQRMFVYRLHQRRPEGSNDRGVPETPSHSPRSEPTAGWGTPD